MKSVQLIKIDHTGKYRVAQQQDYKDIVKTAESIAKDLSKVEKEVQSVIYGQEDVIKQTLVTIFAGGHCLLVGLPGLAKTKLVATLSTVLGLQEGRIQCTPDLMPADILGSEVLETNKAGEKFFRFIKGPIFCQLLMADEINRANPRSQSALLQAMQEKQVSIAGETYDLPKPFFVLATQNPLEQEGTYPLPEAQLDRFMLQVSVGYPSADAEEKMLINTTVGGPEEPPKKILSAKDVLKVQELVRLMPLTEEMMAAILRLVRAGRPETSSIPLVKKSVKWGPSPRASQTLSLAVRAKALLEGRLAPSMQDILELAAPVLRHRMALSFGAKAEGTRIEDVILKMCEQVEA